MSSSATESSSATGSSWMIQCDPPTSDSPPEDPYQWGRPFWRFLHLCAAAYEDDPCPERKEATEAWIHLLPHVLPCGTCSDHLDENLETLPPNVSNRDAFLDWTIELHDRVNRATGKPADACWSKERAREHYKQRRTTPWMQNTPETSYSDDVAPPTPTSVSFEQYADVMAQWDRTGEALMQRRPDTMMQQQPQRFIPAPVSGHPTASSGQPTLVRRVLPAMQGHLGTTPAQFTLSRGGTAHTPAPPAPSHNHLQPNDRRAPSRPIAIPANQAGVSLQLRQSSKPPHVSSSDAAALFRAQHFQPHVRDPDRFGTTAPKHGQMVRVSASAGTPLEIAHPNNGGGGSATPSQVVVRNMAGFSVPQKPNGTPITALNSKTNHSSELHQTETRQALIEHHPSGVNTPAPAPRPPPLPGSRNHMAAASNPNGSGCKTCGAGKLALIKPARSKSAPIGSI